MSVANGPRAGVPSTTRRDMARRLDAGAPDFESAFTALLDAKRDQDEDVAATVRAIVAEVRARGDAALVELTERFDKVKLTSLRLSAEDIDAAEAQCSKEALK